MAESLKIEVYRNKSIDELSKCIADPENRAEAGSAAAASAAIAAALLARVSLYAFSHAEEADEKLNWYVRNSEILRNYMVQLIDEDIRCRGPLRRALKEGDDRSIEASRQAAVSICLEIINMSGKMLEMAAEMLPYVRDESSAWLEECVDLAFGASLAAGRFVLHMVSLSPDDTYRYVMKRENEITMQEQKSIYERILVSVRKK